MLFNANGLSGKADAIWDFCLSNQIDYAFVLETWLKPGNSPIVGNVFINMTNTTEAIIIGGRRATGGIIGFSPSGKQNNVTIVSIDREGRFVVVEIDHIIIVVAYYPPSTPDPLLQDLFEHIELSSNNYERNTILMGDLNGRLGAFNDDHSLNQRGRVLLECLEDSSLRYCFPTSGKFTTWTRTGNGITDHVMCTVRVCPIMINYTIHEHQSLGGSDHRPLTFELNQQLGRQRAQFSRWHIRRFMQQRYRDLFNHYLQPHEQVDRILDKIEQQVSGHRHHHTALTVNERQSLADIAWNEVAGWIENALEQSVGVFTYRPRLQEDFWTLELRAKQAEIEQMDPQDPAYTVANQEYRDMLKDQRYKLFHEECERLGDPQFDSTFLKMIKSRKKRLNRGPNALDKEKFDEYIRHFETTFAGVPTGLPEEKDHNVLRTSDTKEAIVPTEGLNLALNELETIIRFLGNGKSPGIDGMPAEVFRHGSTFISPRLLRLFKILTQLQIVPTEWQKALIHPVYKNKNSRQDFANYRPIALTVVCRRIYERLLLPMLEPAIAVLEDNQGGFRRHRSTHQQVFYLDQLMKQNPDAVNILLDLRAAYDVVDRDILWSILSKDFNVDMKLIAILRSLFDHNSSCIVLEGARSQPFNNLRGLLQGSSLSPILFNFFINSLIKKLKYKSKVSVCGVLSNSLFFADDANLHAPNIVIAKELLLICEQWSNAVGMTFAPSKCVVIAKRQAVLSLYNERLPQPAYEKYLGFYFTWEGISWTHTIDHALKKTRPLIATMTSLGFNCNGWTPRSCIIAFKSFIRPIWEYYLKLGPIPDKYLLKLQRLQNLALRSLFTANRRTSLGAMHRLAQVETVRLRNSFLTAKFAESLHNSTDGRIPAIKLWRRILERNLDPLAIQTCPIWNNEIVKKDHTFFPLNSEYCHVQSSITVEKKRQILLDDLMNIKLGQQRVSNAMKVDQNLKTAHILRAGSLTDPRIKRNIFLWRLGNVCRHQECLKCGAELSRKHGLECSGAMILLEAEFANEYDPDDEMPALCQVLNKYLLAPKNDHFYMVCSNIVALIMRECLHYQQKSNGFYAPEEQGNQEQQVNHPRRGRQHPARIPRRPRPEPENPNPIGRPRKRPRLAQGVG